MKTIQEVIRLGAQFLQERGEEHPRRLTEDLLAHILGMKRIDLYLHFDQPVEEGELVRLRDFMKRAAKGEPFGYIVGEVEFLGCKIEINRSVLIPRQETEILTDLILKKCQGKRVWDVCCGSGAIGIALKKKRSDWEVTLSDLSKEALVVARRNAEKNGVAVEIVEGDLLAPFRGRKADAVVCNPPYISSKEYLELDPSVRGFEPREALVGGERGTEFYERLAVELPALLETGGRLFLEIGEGQGNVLRKIFTPPFWGAGELIKDWSGKDRFFFLEKQ